MHHNSIPIVQKDLNGNILNYFDSCASAERFLGFKQDFISRVVRGFGKTAYVS